MDNKFFDGFLVLSVASLILLSGCSVNTTSESKISNNSNITSGLTDPECEKIRGQSVKDLCYKTTAKLENNADYCDQIQDESTKNECLDQFNSVINNGTPATTQPNNDAGTTTDGDGLNCEDESNQIGRDMCYRAKATAENNPALCDNIQDQTRRQACIDFLQ